MVYMYSIRIRVNPSGCYMNRIPRTLQTLFKHSKHFVHSEHSEHFKRVKHFEPIGHFCKLKEIDFNVLQCVGR